MSTTDPSSSSSTAMSTQPISFSKDHSSSASQDYPMGSASIGSYNGSNGSFNPASYARHYLGSPLSWQPASSFGGRIFASGSPTAQLLVSSFECVAPYAPSQPI